MKISFRSALALLLCLGLAGCDGAVPTNSSAADSPRPEVAAWMSGHAELGTLDHTENVEPWAQGDRQRVVTQNDRKLLFYTQNGAVVSVYEETGNGRVTVFQRGAVAPASATPAAPATREVRYVMTGVGNSRSANITTPDGYLMGEPLPWSKTATMPFEGSVNLKASGVGANGEFFVAEIYVDGQLVARDESQIPDIKASCDAKGCQDF